MKLNGCHNRAPFVNTVVVQSGWQYEQRMVDLSYVRMPVMVEVPNVMTKDCQYSILTPDPRCAGCTWYQQPPDVQFMSGTRWHEDQLKAMGKHKSLKINRVGWKKP